LCGRFGLWANPKQVADHFQLQEPLPFTPRYNIAPSHEVLAVGQTREGTRKAAWLRWGLVPHWARDEKVGYKMINARAVTIVTTRANEAMDELHDRMSVVIWNGKFDLWLDKSVEDQDQLL
jgi:putative SOS response-associated peptidase YedK